MNSLAQSWNRLAAAARTAAEQEAVSAPSPAWVTRVAAWGLAELRRERAQPVWSTWALPGLGIATLVAVVAVAVSSPTIAETNHGEDLVALADPFAGGGLLP